METEKLHQTCQNLLADLYSARNLLENGLEIKAHRKLQGALTRCLELYTGLLPEGSEQKDEPVAQEASSEV